nr:hypothetical protein [Tanacetum cinerariifolium]
MMQLRFLTILPCPSDIQAPRAVEDTLPAGEGIPAAALTIPAGSTTIPAGSSMDTVIQAAAATPSSTIPAADKGKAPMDTDDSLHADLLSEKQSFPDSKRSWHRRLKLKVLLHLLNKVPTKVSTAPSTVVVVSVSAAPSTTAAVSVFAAPSIPTDESVSAAPSVTADT